MRAILLLALVALSGCSFFGSDDPVVCTLEFRLYTVRVVNEAGQPVDDLTATVTNERTGEVLISSDDPFPSDDGHYPVTSDAHIDLLAEDGDPVLFHAEGDGLVAEATFRFAGGPCHVEKLAGPETIVAEAE